jgi:hypothetical protein
VRIGQSAPRNLEFLQHGATALADCGVGWVFSNVRRVVPAALALLPVGFFDFNPDATGAIPRTLRETNRGHDKQKAQLGLVAFQERKHWIRRREVNLSLKPGANQLGVAGLFERLKNFIANRAQSTPVFVLLFVLLSYIAAQNVGGGEESGNVYAVRAALNFRQIRPDLFTGKTRDRSQQTHQRFADPPHGMI